jgi:putative nucleotidyltransferase with HDIG domain
MWDQKSIEASRSIDSGIENKSIKVRRVNNRISVGKIFDETINGWVHAIELRDKEAVGHAHRVANLTMDLAQRIGIRDQKLDDLRRGALLHDIGKIAIPDEILFKPGKLTDDEWEIMKKHPDYAYEMLTPISFLQNSLDIPYCHHEHWDGTGYPRGLRECEIPISARIFTVIDVWDALSSDRCYRKAWNQADVQDYIIQNKGLLFDPEIVDIFLSLLRSQYETDDISLVTPFTQREFHFNETQMERS